MSYWDGTNWVRGDAAPRPEARPSRRRHVTEAIAEGTLIALLTVGLIAGTAFAAKGGGKSSIWVNELTSARSTGLSLGDSFTVGYETGRTAEPWGRVLCYANETTVVSDAARASNYWPMIWGRTYSLYEGGPTPQPFVLSTSHYWLGGGADCTVDLIKFSSDYTRIQVLAQTSFVAVP